MHHRQLLFYPLSMFMLLSVSSSEPSMFSACSAATIGCGGYNWTIAYPFRLPDMPAGCGHPGFQVQCVRDKSVLLLNIAGKDYGISNIRYDTQFVGVSNLDFMRDTCPLTFSNTTVDLSLFSYSGNCMNMTAFLNCSPVAYSHALKNIPCLSNNTSNQSYYSLPTDGSPPPADLFGRCASTVLIPMYMDDRDLLDKGRLDFLGVLQEGFGLEWVVGGGWCGECANSGGICGNDPSSPGAPTCFCGDGTVTNGTCPGVVVAVDVMVGGVAATAAGDGVDMEEGEE